MFLSFWPTSQSLASLRSIKTGGPGSAVGSEGGAKPKSTKPSKGDAAAKSKGKAKTAKTKKHQTS